MGGNKGREGEHGEGEGEKEVRRKKWGKGEERK